MRFFLFFFFVLAIFGTAISTETTPETSTEASGEPTGESVGLIKMNNSVRWLTSLILLGLASAAVFQHELHRRESLRTKLIKEGRWKEYIAQKEHRLRGRFSNFKSTSQNINDYDDVEYYVNVTVGTPDQVFTVFLDTTIGSMIIIDINCTDCNKVTKFDSSKSSTYQKTSYPLYNQTVYGMYGQDFVRFGDPGTDQLVIPKALFGQALIDVTDGSVDGIMGLGLTTENPDGLDPPIITAINSGILDKPVVTFFLRRRGSNGSSNNTGVVTYGAVDTVNCDRNIIYESLSDPNNFQVSVKNAALGSSQFSDGWDAYIDTGTGLLLGPQSVVEAFAKEVNAAFNFQYGLYTIDCNATFNLSLTIGDTVYTLTEKDMVLDIIENKCVFGLLALESDMWVFGDPWFRIVCNVLDYGNKRIGFASVINP